MNVDGAAYRTIWVGDDGWSVEIIDQTRLPHEFVTTSLRSLKDACTAIADMQVRGAPLIGATAAYGICLALREGVAFDVACAQLATTRPTAINLRWALEKMRQAVAGKADAAALKAAYETAALICEEDVEICAAIGRHGLGLIEACAAAKKDAPVNIMTHCNAGWLATVDWGTATAPIYMAHEAGMDVHVWVSETRPRNQGGLTAWELAHHGVPHTLIADNAAGHLMQRGLVDMVIVGTDRTTATGDVANKIGTYMKALAAHDSDVPFYVALPSPTIDWDAADGMADIPIEQRSGGEVTTVRGRAGHGLIDVDLYDAGVAVRNDAFDVTPARLITGLITEHGIVAPTPEALARLRHD